MSAWTAKDFADDGAILDKAAASSDPRIVGFLVTSDAGVYLTRDDLSGLRDACDQLLAGGAS